MTCPGRPIKGAVDTEDTRPPLSGILASHGTSVKRPGAHRRRFVEHREHEGHGAPPLVAPDRGRSLPMLASWPMMSPMSVLARLGPLAEYRVRADTPRGTLGRQRS
jgi:hypothetical protein